MVRAVTLNPNDPIALANLHWYFAVEETRYDLALWFSERASSIQPNNALHYTSQGWTWVNLHNPDKAEGFFIKAVEIQPDYSGAIIGLTLLYREWKDDYQKGISLLQQGLSYNPSAIDLNHQLGQQYSWQGNFEESEKYFLNVKEVVEQKNYTITRRTPWFPHRYAYTLWNLGKMEEANKYFQQQIERDLTFLHDRVQVHGFFAYYDLAAVNAFLGNKEQAYYWLNELLENNSWARSSHILKDPLFDSLKGDQKFERFMDAYNSRITRLRKHYEEIKDLPFNEFLKQMEEPLPQYLDLLD